MNEPPRRAVLLAALVITLAPLEIATESLTLNTYYPAPLGSYASVTTTGDSFLSRDDPSRLYVGLTASGDYAQGIQNLKMDTGGIIAADDVFLKKVGRFASEGNPIDTGEVNCTASWWGTCTITVPSSVKAIIVSGPPSLVYYPFYGWYYGWYWWYPWGYAYWYYYHLLGWYAPPFAPPSLTTVITRKGQQFFYTLPEGVGTCKIPTAGMGNPYWGYYYYWWWWYYAWYGGYYAATTGNCPNLVATSGPDHVTISFPSTYYYSPYTGWTSGKGTYLAFE